MISIDGTTGRVYLGEVPVQPSPVVQYFEGKVGARGGSAGGARCIDCCSTPTPRGPCGYAPTPTPLRTRPGPAGSAREGIGLCRTEHMFLGDRRELVERLILATTDEEREAALAALLPLQRDDFVEIFERDGRPAGDGPSARPAAARVPPAPDRAGGQGGGRGGARARTRAGTRRCWRRFTGCTSRTRCWGCAGSGWDWSFPGCSPCRCGRSPRPRPSGSRRGRPTAGDHGAVGRRGAGAGDGPAGSRAGDRGCGPPDRGGLGRRS